MLCHGSILTRVHLFPPCLCRAVTFLQCMVAGALASPVQQPPSTIASSPRKAERPVPWLACLLPVAHHLTWILATEAVRWRQSTTLDLSPTVDVQVATISALYSSLMLAQLHDVASAMLVQLTDEALYVSSFSFACAHVGYALPYDDTPRPCPSFRPASHTTPFRTPYRIETVRRGLARAMVMLRGSTHASSIKRFVCDNVPRNMTVAKARVAVDHFIQMSQARPLSSSRDNLALSRRLLSTAAAPCRLKHECPCRAGSVVAWCGLTAWFAEPTAAPPTASMAAPSPVPAPSRAASRSSSSRSRVFAASDVHDQPTPARVSKRRRVSSRRPVT